MKATSLADEAIALGLAFNGPVFPCYPSKKPATNTGFYEASHEPAAIRAMFAKAGCKLIGLRTGQASEQIVVDVDIKEGKSGHVWLKLNEHRLPKTRTVQTASGGLHLHFKRPGDGLEIRNSDSVIGLHVDVRGEGGYALSGPEPYYKLIDDAPPADMPDWLLADIAEAAKPPVTVRPPITTPLTDQLEKRYLGLAHKLLDNLRKAPDGRKHSDLLSNAIAMGGIIDHFGVPADDAVSWLLSALPDSVEDWRTAERTARDGIRYGRASPITLDDRPRPATAKPAYAPAMPTHSVSVQVAAEEAPAANVVVQLHPAAEKPAVDPNTFGRLRVLSVEDAMDVTPRPYLLEGLIAPGELSVWYGQPKCGKSFLMLRVAYGLALGQGMWGREAEQSAVLYVAAEGEHGVMGRIRALHEAMGPAPLFRFIAQRVDLFDPNADLRDLIAAAKAVGARLLVLDTMARVMPGGDENSTRDMGVFVSNCDTIREQTGAHVAIVHHSGWSGEHSRGSIALPGAADLIMRICGQPEGGAKTALIEMAKDSESGICLGFNLQSHSLPPDAKGNPRTTCVAVEAEEAPTKRATDGLKRDEPEWLKDLIDMFAVQGGPATERTPVDGMEKQVTLLRDEVRDGYRKKGRLGNGEVTQPLSSAERKKLHDKLNTLRDKGKIGLTDTMVWLLK